MYHNILMYVKIKKKNNIYIYQSKYNRNKEKYTRIELIEHCFCLKHVKYRKYINEILIKM